MGIIRLLRILLLRKIRRIVTGNHRPRRRVATAAGRAATRNRNNNKNRIRNHPCDKKIIPIIVLIRLVLQQHPLLQLPIKSHRENDPFQHPIKSQTGILAILGMTVMRIPMNSIKRKRIKRKRIIKIPSLPPPLHPLMELKDETTTIVIVIIM